MSGNSRTHTTTNRVAAPVTKVTTGRFAHIDALRALAVLLVVVYHAGAKWIPGPSGVTIFFTISGFVITFIVLREHERTGGFDVANFYVRRAFKIFPPFLLLILIPTAIYAAFRPVNWLAVLSQMLFTYNWAEVAFPEEADAVLPGSSVVWSLGVEEQFYIVFSFVWLWLAVKTIRSTRILAWIAVGTIVYSTSLRLALVVAHADPIRLARATDTRVDAIAWGVLGAIAYMELRRGGLARFRVLVAGPWTLLLSALVAIASMAMTGYSLRYTVGYSALEVATVLLILYGLVARDGLASRLFGAVTSLRVVQVIGLASYSIYLAHLPLSAVASPLLTTIPAGGRTVALSALGIAAGVLVYYAIEVPALRIRRAKVDPRFANRI